MRNLFAFFTLFATFATLVSCSDDDDRIYVSVSGNGSLIVDYDQPEYLYRMVFFDNTSDQEIYLLGSSAYVTADAQFSGRGAVVKIVINDQSLSTESSLEEQSFSIDGSDYTVSYSTYVNYLSGENEGDFITISSGTVVIRRAGLYYDLRLLGTDSEGQSIICAYAGYIYRSFTESDEVKARS